MTITLTRKPTRATAILFDGTNGAAVVQFVRDAGESARNGGSYVSINTDSQGIRVRKGDYVILEADGSLSKQTKEGLDKLYRPYPNTRKGVV